MTMASSLGRRAILAASGLVLSVAILFATGWGSAVAAQISNVFVTNDSAHPVPVQEQRTDANGNIKVHEQGTANVNVTNGSLSVDSPTPITDGGSFRVFNGTRDFDAPVTASALAIHMSDSVVSIEFRYRPAQFPASFPGPELGGIAEIVLALDRPIKFDQIICVGEGACSVGWMGASP
jgi:hypothetical protein